MAAFASQICEAPAVGCSCGRPRLRLPSAAIANAAIGAEHVFDLQHGNAPRGSLRVAVDERSRDSVRVQAFAVQTHTGRGTVLPRHEGVFALDNLPPGHYRVVLLGSSVGYSDLGEHWVDGHSVTDLGAHVLPESAHLEIPNRVDDDQLELYLRRSQLDVRAALMRHGQTRFELPAGDWLMLTGDPSSPRMRAFSLEPGEQLTLHAGGFGRARQVSGQTSGLVQCGCTDKAHDSARLASIQERTRRSSQNGHSGTSETPTSSHTLENGQFFSKCARSANQISNRNNTPCNMPHTLTASGCCQTYFSGIAMPSSTR